MLPDLDRPAGSLSPSELIENFTNRVKEQDVFARVLKISSGTPLPVVHFYGVGGTGKTWLLRKLQETALTRHIPNAFVDLGNLPFGAEASTRALASLRGQLSAFHLPHFDIAFGWYCHKMGYAKDHPARAGSGPAGAVADYIGPNRASR